MSGPFAALDSRNYRLYVFGQIVSMSGSWMQRLAQAWLVLDLTGSPVALGTVTALQFLPILTLSLTAGVFADRLPKRGFLAVLQFGALVQASLFAGLTLTNRLELWHVYALAVLLGCVNAFDNTTRNSFVTEMVPREHVQSAVALNASIQNLARVAGPAVGGVVIAAFGAGWCFVFNAASYVAVLGALGLMQADRLQHPPPPISGSIRSQLADGVRYARSQRSLSTALIVMGFVGVFGLNFSVALPLLARFAFDAGPVGLGLLNAAQGVGAVAGSLVVAGAGRPHLRRLLASSLAFGAILAGVGLAPVLAASAVLMLAAGVAQTYYTASTQTLLQLDAREEYRGRVLSMYSFLTAGSTPVGATFTGALADLWGIRATLCVNAALTVCGVVVGWARLRGLPREGAAR